MQVSLSISRTMEWKGSDLKKGCSWREITPLSPFWKRSNMYFSILFLRNLNFLIRGKESLLNRPIKSSVWVLGQKPSSQNPVAGHFYCTILDFEQMVYFLFISKRVCYFLISFIKIPMSEKERGRKKKWFPAKYLTSFWGVRKTRWIARYL